MSAHVLADAGHAVSGVLAVAGLRQACLRPRRVHAALVAGAAGLAFVACQSGTFEIVRP